MGEISDLERPRLGDDLKQHPHHPQLPVIDPADGLPKMATATTMQDSLAPPLTVETFVCMADESEFEVEAYLKPPAIKCHADIDKPPHLVPSMRFPANRAFFNEQLGEWYVHVVSDSEAPGRPRFDIGGVPCVKVKPVRPQCVYYKRTMTDFEGQEAITQVERVCTAQRTEGGEYISLRDTRVHACEHRSPRDLVSEQRLRRFDAARLHDAKKRDEEFDVEAALAAATQAAEESSK